MTINSPIPPLKGIGLIIGLGNPGKDYENTYHNAGYLAIDYLIDKLHAQNTSTSKRHFVAFETEHLYLVKSVVFMNQSGAAVSEAIRFFKIRPDQTLIIHDESDLEIGKFKISFGRGGAGHNGIASIFSHLKTKNFWRLRLGIRPPSRATRRMPASRFVLKKIKPEHLKTLYSVLGGATEKFIENEKP